MLYSRFNILLRSVFWSAYLNGRSDNTDVISLKYVRYHRTQTKHWGSCPILDAVSVSSWRRTNVPRYICSKHCSLVDLAAFPCFRQSIRGFCLILGLRRFTICPMSVPCQRHLGIFMYLSCHVIQFFGPGQILLGLVGYLLFAGPLSLWFLFDHLLED